jgi:hypothetical protein
MFVILNPSPVILSEAKNLNFWLRVNSVKNLMILTESIIEILRPESSSGLRMTL